MSWHNRRLRNTFHNIKGRCYNPNNKDYKWYGGKGIGICKEWLDDPSLFEEWAESNGYSDELTIDRIDPEADYSPENCRWISLEDNARRAGDVNWMTVGGMTMTGREWSLYFNLGLNTINRYRREYGEPATKMLIEAMLEDPPDNITRYPRQSLFSVYEIDT